MGASNILKRIHEHRVNIAYTKEQYFNAYYRLLKSYKKKLRQRRVLFNVSIAIGIVTLSGLLVHLTDNDTKAALMLSTFFSITTIVLSIYLSTLPELKEPSAYLERAEGFLILYKHIKTLEARIADGCIENDCDLGTYLDEIENKSKILYTNPLPMEYEDYLDAKKKIQNGNLSYTDEELQNT